MINIVHRKGPIIYNSINLKKLDVISYGIPRELIEDLVLTSAGSPGVMPKFKINLNRVPNEVKKEPTLSNLFHVKAGEHKGNYYTLTPPVFEKMAFDIGELLGFNVEMVWLILINSDLFEYQPEISDDEEDEGYDYSYGNSAPTFRGVVGEIARDAKVLASMTRSYVNGSDIYTSCRNAIGKARSGKDLYDFLSSYYPEEVMVGIDQMIMFDFIIDNADRHNSNFGFLINDETGETRLCPLVDHEKSFLSGYEAERFEDAEGVRGVLDSAIGHQAGFGNLRRSLQFVNKNSFVGINFDISASALVSIVDKYSPLLIKSRVPAIKQLLTERWNYVRENLRP